MDQLTIGVVATSRKEHERRLAIHPAHIERVPAELRERMYLERGYGERFGVGDEVLAPLVAGLRSRDVLEHIERVLTHVRRLEHSAEVAVQMHFSALGHRTNDIMRTLTVLTAIFLPLNLITGFFGMNFDTLPLIHSATGIWVAVALMAAVFISLFAFFWRKRYLGTLPRR